MKTAVCGPTARDLFRKSFLANTQRWFNIDIRRWDYLENFGIYTQLDRKSRTWFFYFPQCVCFLNLTGQNPNLTAFTSKIQVFCRPKWTKGGTLWKWILTTFKCKNEFPKQLGLEKQIKKWAHLSGFCVSFLSYVP